MCTRNVDSLHEKLFDAQALRASTLVIFHKPDLNCPIGELFFYL